MTTRVVLFSVVILIASCKSKKKQADDSVTKGANTGVVSHMFRSGGCNTVVYIANASDTTFLIPKDPLGKFDKDGLTIHFNYQLLRMPNPQGCTRGNMAALSDISK